MLCFFKDVKCEGILYFVFRPVLVASLRQMLLITSCTKQSEVDLVILIMQTVYNCFLLVMCGVFTDKYHN